MRKMTVVLIIICVGLGVICLMMIHYSYNDASIKSNFDYSKYVTGTLIVNDKEICNIKMDTTGKNAIIPLITVMEEIGFNINWHNGHLATCVLNGNKYTLNTNKKSLIDEDGRNLIENNLSGGKANVYYQLLDKEFYVHSNLLYRFMQMIGYHMEIVPEESYVRIEQKT